MTAYPTTDPHYLSDCHNAAVHLVSSDEGTNYYECVVCKEGCNYHSAELAPPDEQLREAIAINMGLYYRESDNKWLREKYQDGKYIGVENMTLELNSVMKVVQGAQQQLLRELMGEMPDKDSRKHAVKGVDEGIQIGFNTALDQVAALIQHKLDEISGKGGK